MPLVDLGCQGADYYWAKCPKHPPGTGNVADAWEAWIPAGGIVGGEGGVAVVPGSVSDITAPVTHDHRQPLWHSDPTAPGSSEPDVLSMRLTMISAVVVVACMFTLRHRWLQRRPSFLRR